MFTVKIATTGPEFQGNPGDDAPPEAGPVLAAYLRAVADRVEREVSIVPFPGGEWTPERYRMGDQPVAYSITEGGSLPFVATNHKG